MDTTGIRITLRTRTDTLRAGIMAAVRDLGQEIQAIGGPDVTNLRSIAHGLRLLLRQTADGTTSAEDALPESPETYERDVALLALDFATHKHVLAKGIKDEQKQIRVEHDMIRSRLREAAWCLPGRIRNGITEPVPVWIIEMLKLAIKEASPNGTPTG